MLKVFEYRSSMFSARTPKKVIARTLENMDAYGMSLNDAFEEAARALSKKNSELWAAWYFCDYRRFIPSTYLEEKLNFKKYPLRYVKRNGVYQPRY